MTRVLWVACEASTGRQLEFLPELTPGGPLKSTMGRAETCTFSLPLASAPLAWRRATKPWAAWLVALVDDQPRWGAIVTERTLDWPSNTVSMTAATAETVFDGVYVGDTSYDGTVADVDIAVDLVARFVTPLGYPFTVVTHGPGVGRAKAYSDSEDRTVASAFDDLAEYEDGPDFSVRWRSDPLQPKPTFTPELHVGAVGDDPRTRGIMPVTFDLPGCVRSAQLVESYATGRGARRVTATGQKSGDDRPQATVQDDTDFDRPVRELRGSVTAAPGVEVTPDVLLDHANGALPIVAAGSRALTLTADAAKAPQIGTGDGHWDVGDVVAAAVSTPDGKGAGRIDEAWRCIGWEWDVVGRPETVTPILEVPAAHL